MNRESLVHPPRLMVVVGLLILTLGVAAALAWQAYQAAESHRDAAIRVQHDYVEFAGWEFSRAARTELHSRLERWLGGIACEVERGGLPQPTGLGSCGGCRCDDLKPRSLFVVDLGTERLTTTGAPLGPDATRWALDVASGRVRIPPSHRAHLLRVGLVDETPLAMAAAHVRDRFGAPTKIAGFTANPSILAKAFEHVFEHTPLLPPTLAGPRNNLLGLTVRGRDRVAVYASEGVTGSITSEGTLDDTLGDLHYEIALKREGADHLLIGGLPQSRLPVLVGLLMLTAGLLAVALEQLRREHDLARMRADFVASVSHELRTPLAQIRLFSETLLLGRVRSEVEGRRSLEIIQQESRRLSHLVENVLYFARAGRGAERLAFQPTRLSPFAGEVVEAFAPLARSGRANVRLEVAADVTAPVDAGALRQILLNLLDNAVKYGRPDQTIVVGLDYRAGTAILTVDDEGPGVPIDARGQIWQPYSRLSAAASSAVAGTGIGLAVVRELAILHGGRARVDDAPGGGARFVVEFPGASVAPASADQPAPESRVPA